MQGWGRAAPLNSSRIGGEVGGTLPQLCGTRSRGLSCWGSSDCKLSEAVVSIVHICAGTSQTAGIIISHEVCISSMEDLTAFQRDMLYVIAGLNGPNGLEIKDGFEEYYAKEVHHGQVYPNLDTLVDKGLVDKGQLDRRTNVYTLTKRARREIESRREWEEEYVALEA
jgi:PadR family transcriptional regulator, regulatory protein PadR